MVSFWIRDEKRDEAFLYTPWPAMMLLNQRQAGRHGFTKRKRFYGVGMHQSGFSYLGEGWGLIGRRLFARGASCRLIDAVQSRKDLFLSCAA